MESEKQFQPKPEKPKILYHASRNSSVSSFEPRRGKKRDESEGAQIFATPSKAMATIFLVDTDDSWTQSGAIDGNPYIVISDRDRFESLDQGGTIYALPSDTFESAPEKGLRELEYTSSEPVAPISSESVQSGLEAMLESGVQVYFVDREMFEHIKNAEEASGEIIKSLEPHKKF